jgi:NADH dehydrogenase (ubiquinone) 1 alpha/beta subcomplex 1
MSFFRLATQSLSRSTLGSARIASRYIPHARYSASAGLSREVIQTRVFDVLRGFEKVDKAKVRHSCSCLIQSLTSWATAAHSSRILRKGPWS